MTNMRIVGSSVIAALLSCTLPSVVQAEDLRVRAVWLGPTLSMPFVSQRRFEWGGEVTLFYKTPSSRIGLGFDLGASSERVYADALLYWGLSEHTGWFLNGGPVLGYGAVDGIGGRVGVSGWAAPFFLPLVFSVNVIAMPNAPLLFLGTFSIKVGGGF